MGHARRPVAAAVAATLLAGCAAAPPAPTGPLDGLEAEWFYVPGPYRTTQRVDGDLRAATVEPERAGAWSVRFGDPATTIVVTRLDDGRPATARIADAGRDETVVFDPPLALVPVPGSVPPATESADIALYQGLWPDATLHTRRPTRRGTAERRFLGAEDLTWTLDGRSRPAQRLLHELVLELGPATIRQVYESVAVEGMGIVEEALEERVIVLGVRIGGRMEHVEVIEFVDDP